MSNMRWCIDKAELNRSGKDRLEIRGWIWNKKGRKLSAKVYADKQEELTYKLTWVKRPDVQKYLKLSEDSGNLGFVIYIQDVSKFWNDFKELEVLFSDGTEKAQVFQKEFSEIKKMYANSLFQYHIDSASIVEDSVIVRGWAAFIRRKCVRFWSRTARTERLRMRVRERCVRM